ncbi:MAG TPA: hypothetical protein VN704_08430 [Verrucomicrobiae bacterium]|nr:hypothetical protein [Verrucomicrobiae bacterium]
MVPFFYNKRDAGNNIKEIITKLKTALIDNASKIFEENKMIYSDRNDNTTKTEFWKEKDVST